MRHMENACCGCGAMGGECLHCESEVITCDGCGCEIDGKAYAFPEDPDEEDYCEACFMNRVNDVKEFSTTLDACPYCDNEDTEVFHIGDVYFCEECIDSLLNEFERKEG